MVEHNVPIFVRYREATKTSNGLEVMTFDTFGFVKEETDLAILLEHRRSGTSDKGKEFFDNANRYEPILKSSIIERKDLMVVTVENAKNLPDETTVPTEHTKPSANRRRKDSEGPGVP